MKNYFLIVLFVASVLLSCKKDDNDDTNSGKSDVTKVENQTSISGSSNYEFSMAMEDASYMVTFREKEIGNIEDYSIWVEIFGGWTNLLPGSSFALNTSTNWYEGSDITKFTDSDTYKYKIIANGDYEIIYEKLPLTKTTVAAPQNYSGMGRKVFGPVTLSENTTFIISCADAKQAGFTIELYTSLGAEILDADYHVLYVNLDGNSNAINTIDKTLSRTLAAGEYLINVDANYLSEYTIKVQ